MSTGIVVWITYISPESSRYRQWIRVQLRIYWRPCLKWCMDSMKVACVLCVQLAWSKIMKCSIESLGGTVLLRVIEGSGENMGTGIPHPPKTIKTRGSYRSVWIQEPENIFRGIVDNSADLLKEINLLTEGNKNIKCVVTQCSAYYVKCATCFSQSGRIG